MVFSNIPQHDVGSIRSPAAARSNTTLPTSLDTDPTTFQKVLTIAGLAIDEIPALECGWKAGLRYLARTGRMGSARRCDRAAHRRQCDLVHVSGGRRGETSCSGRSYDHVSGLTEPQTDWRRSTAFSSSSFPSEVDAPTLPSIPQVSFA